MKQEAIIVGLMFYYCITPGFIKTPFNSLPLAYFGLRIASQLAEIHEGEVGGFLVGGLFFWLPTKRGYPFRGGPWYAYLSEDQRRCEQFYGAPYLTHIATHQMPYCEPASLGHLQCFTAQRLPKPWTSDWEQDPLCLAQGVLFNPSGEVPFSLQCTPRNFTREAALFSAVEADEELKNALPLDNMGVYWFDTGIGTQLRDWAFEDKKNNKGCTKDNNNGGWVLLARREGNTNIWHKLMEIWQAMLTVDALQIARDPTTGKPWLSREEAAAVTVVFEDDREEPLDPWWKMATGNALMRRSAIAPDTCFGHVILPLAGSSSPFWSALLEAVYHETCRTQFLLNTFLHRLFDLLQLTPRPASEVNASPTVTIIDRKRTRKFIDLDRWVATLRKKHPGSVINVVDFATISLLDQVKLVQSTDVLVGHHGAGMTHVLFLPPEAAVVEIMPPWFPTRGFRSVARMRGLTHFSGRCMWEEEYNAVVGGVPLPEGWRAPQSAAGWQEREWAYMTEEGFVDIVNAAILSQKNRRNDGT